VANFSLLIFSPENSRFFFPFLSLQIGDQSS
jgi:hypothetical protein